MVAEPPLVVTILAVVVVAHQPQEQTHQLVVETVVMEPPQVCLVRLSLMLEAEVAAIPEELLVQVELVVVEMVGITLLVLPQLQTPAVAVAVLVALLILLVAVLAALVLSSSRPINNEGNMATKIYRLYGIDTAMHLLRPGAKWEITNSHFSNWEDPRPCPKWEEVLETMEKIKAFEDSINTVWLPEQIEALTGQAEIQAQVDRIIEEQKAA